MKTNRHGFLASLKNPPFHGRGDHDSEQLQHGNLVATVWNDEKQVSC